MDGLTNDEVRLLEEVLTGYALGVHYDPDDYKKWEIDALEALEMRVRGQIVLRKMDANGDTH